MNSCIDTGGGAGDVSVFDMRTNLAFLTSNIQYFISLKMTVDYVIAMD